MAIEAIYEEYHIGQLRQKEIQNSPPSLQKVKLIEDPLRACFLLMLVPVPTRAVRLSAQAPADATGKPFPLHRQFLAAGLEMLVPGTQCRQCLLAVGTSKSAITLASMLAAEGN